MAKTHWGVSVPMLSTKAPARETISSTSSWAWAITGEAPAAKSTLALKFITTRLVMLCTRGLLRRIRAKSLAAWADSVAGYLDNCK